MRIRLKSDAVPTKNIFENFTSSGKYIEDIFKIMY